MTAKYVCTLITGRTIGESPVSFSIVKRCVPIGRPTLLFPTTPMAVYYSTSAPILTDGKSKSTTRASSKPSSANMGRAALKATVPITTTKLTGSTLPASGFTTSQNLGCSPSATSSILATTVLASGPWPIKKLVSANWPLQSFATKEN